MPFNLDRRTLLRGVAAGGATVAIPLPRLAGMLNGNGTAYADATPLPKCFGTWIFGNGTGPYADHWAPATEGTGDSWQLSQLLMPLASVKSHLSVVTGMKNDSLIGTSAHIIGATNALTGGSILTHENPTPRLPSIDQVIAKGGAFQGTPIQSLQAGVCTASEAPTPEASTQCHISFSGPNAPNPAEINPRALFNRLFMPGTPTDAQSLTLARKANDVRRSVLDLVIADARRLRARLGAEDRMRLDKHCDAVRLLENQITAADQSLAICPTANAGNYPDRKANQECPPELDDIMGSLVVLALACDRTRVFAYEFTKPSSLVVYRNLGFESEFHGLCHDETRQMEVEKGVTYAMTQLGKFLDKLKSASYGAGNLLDSSCVYVTSDLGDGLHHAHDNVPVLIGGKAGGALRGNVSHKATDENISKVLFTLANVMGLGVTSYGADVCKVTDGVGAIVA